MPMQISTKQQNLNPEYANTYYERGNAYFDKGEYDIAITAYSKAIELKPDYADAYFCRGASHHNKAKKEVYSQNQKKELALALLDYNEALLHDTENIDAWYNRGKIYAGKGFLVSLEGIFINVSNMNKIEKIEISEDYKEALLSYNEALRIVPNAVDVLLSRGSLFYILNDFDNALKDFEAILHIDPDHELAMLKRRICYKFKGELERAVEDLSKLIEENPDNAEAWCRRARVWHKMFERDLMKSDYNEAIKRDHSYIQAYKELGEYYQDYERNGYQKAEEVYLEAIKYYPANVEFYKALGDLYQNMGKHDKARTAYDEALKYGEKTKKYL